MSYVESAIERLNNLIENSQEGSEERIDYVVMKQACEKQTSVSRIIRNGKYYCPRCDTEAKTSGFCNECGQKLY